MGPKILFFSTIFGFPVEYSTGVEISTWKLFLWKVHIIGYIFHIHHMCSKCILMKLRAFEVTRKITVFGENHFQNSYLRVHRMHSRGRLRPVSRSLNAPDIDDKASTFLKKKTIFWPFSTIFRALLPKQKSRFFDDF